MIKFLLAFGWGVLFSSIVFAADVPTPLTTPAPAPVPAPVIENEHMSTSRYVIGGILGVYPGFGIGHAVQGRYKERGWVFTAGELGTLMLFSMGATTCAFSALSGGGECTNSAMILGAYGFLGFKIWEIVDVWATPASHNMIEGAERPPAHETSLSLLPPTREKPALLALNWSF